MGKFDHEVDCDPPSPTRTRTARRDVAGAARFPRSAVSAPRPHLPASRGPPVGPCGVSPSKQAGARSSPASSARHPHPTTPTRALPGATTTLQQHAPSRCGARSPPLRTHVRDTQTRLRPKGGVKRSRECPESPARQNPSGVRPFYYAPRLISRSRATSPNGSVELDGRPAPPTAVFEEVVTAHRGARTGRFPGPAPLTVKRHGARKTESTLL